MQSTGDFNGIPAADYAAEGYGDPAEARAEVAKVLGRPMNRREETLFRRWWTMDDIDATAFAGSFVRYGLHLRQDARGRWVKVQP